MSKLLTFGLGVLVTISFISCGKENGNVLKGSIDGVEDGTQVFISELGKGYMTEVVDSTEIKNGEFTVDLPESPIQTLSILSINGVNGSFQFINEDTPLAAELYKDSLQASAISGGPANELFLAYRDKLAKGNRKVMNAADALSHDEMNDMDARQSIQDLQLQIEQDISEFRKESIEEHPDLLPSLLMLFDMEQTRMVPQPEMKKLYDKLSPQIKDYFMGEEMGQRLEQASALAVGAKAPSFKAETPEGEELALEDALGEYTLVDFWAAWCVPCRKENPNIVKVYNKYHEKGFNVLGVSLDKTRDDWLGAIQKDGLKWNQISNLRFWNDPIAKQYNIKAIPANFLLDKEGVIVARDLRGPNLEKKIGELLDEVEEK